VLEGVPTQDMLVVLEMDKQQMEEADFLVSTSPQQVIPHVSNLRRIAKSMQPKHFIALLRQVVVGGQLIIKSESMERRKLALLALASLIPVGCVKPAFNSNGYVYSYKCNLLGCSTSTVIPAEVQHEVLAVILPSSGGSVESLNAEESTLTLREGEIQLDGNLEQGEIPAIVLRYLQLLLGMLALSLV